MITPSAAAWPVCSPHSFHVSTLTTSGGDSLPTTSGRVNSRNATRKSSTHAPNTLGLANASVTCRNVRANEAPLEVEASSSSRAICPIPAWLIR